MPDLHRRDILKLGGAVVLGGWTALAEERKPAGLVVGQPEGAKTGMDVLEAGGNAVDAAVAAALVAGVVAAPLCGIGGYGGHMVIASADGKKITAIDFNSTAPAAARDDMFPLDEKGVVKGGVNLAGLTRLNLSFTMVGDAGLVHFKDCTNLTYLNLDSTQVSDAGLAYFKNCTNLSQLLLGRMKVTDAGLAHFKDCKKLTLLDLSEVSVGDAELGYFKECEHLTRLGLGRTLVTDAGLAHFKNCKKLQHVNLLGTKVGNVGLAYLKDCKELTGLFIGSTKVTDLSLIKDLPLKELDFDFRPERDAEILRSIKTLETINRKPAAEFWKEVDEGKTSFAPFTDAGEPALLCAKRPSRAPRRRSGDAPAGSSRLSAGGSQLRSSSKLS